MSLTSDEVTRYANESGFPLQIAVQHAVDNSVSNTGWSVRYVEHGWVHPTGGQRGFIDLVLHTNKRQDLFFVVECKRVRETAWVFMHYSGKATNRLHAKPWVTYASGEKIYFDNWGTATVEPVCPEATFCAIRGQTSSERNTLLEKTGAELVLATEALAAAERNFRRVDVATRRLYFPMIVTTAELKVADFDPADVSLQDGHVRHSMIRDVPYLRFRKQLATRFVELLPSDFENLGDPSYSMESSIFVVQAKNLVEFLSQFRASAQ